MTKELVPEMHDIGKLQNKYEHNFEDAKTDIDSLTWVGIKEHHCQLSRPGKEKVLLEYPKRVETFFLCIADNLASAVSRSEEGRGHPTYNVHKLWNPPREKIAVPPIRSDKAVQELITFIGTKPNADDFFTRYKKELEERTEDAHPGANITSLYTHSKLTGQFYRILTSTKDLKIEITDIGGKSKEEICNLLKNAQNTWKLTVFKIKIHFPQNPVRARDMNVFKVLEGLIEDTKQKFQDNVIFSTSNELLFVNPLGSNALEYIKDKAKEFGFWLDVRKDDQQIKQLNLEEIRNPSSEYPSLSSEIEPPVCEICQMAKGTKEWVRDTVTEQLCEKCYSIRELGARLPKIGDWEESEDNPKVVYLKVSLDMEELVKILKGLYIEYLKNVGIPNPEDKAEIRFSVIAEFQKDYDAFLSTLESKIITEYREENFQLILKDFFCLKIEREREIKRILEIYRSKFKEYFPKFISNPSIKLSMTCANVKFPFIWNWKILENPKNDVTVSLIGRGEMNLKMKQIDELLKVSLPSRNFLLDLSKAAEISKKLAWIMLNDKGNRGAYKEFDGLRRAVTSSGIDYDTILVFSKIMGS